MIGAAWLQKLKYKLHVGVGQGKGSCLPRRREGFPKYYLFSTTCLSTTFLQTPILSAELNRTTGAWGLQIYEMPFAAPCSLTREGGSGSRTSLPRGARQPLTDS